MTSYPYINGDTIPQKWNGIFIVFAFVTSFVASFSAVRLLDHTLWRSEKEKEHASTLIIKYPKAVAAFLLGFGTVWSMHFVGMAAVTLDRTPVCYNWPVTVGSLVSAVGFMWAGVAIASRDVFRGPDRVKRLQAVIVNRPGVTAKGRHNEASRAIHTVAFFYRPWFVVAGGLSAATGALIMHYTGMMALHGPFQKRWSVSFVAASVILGAVVCIAGFWILFRLLLWKVEQFWLRPASAAVIASAVCALHFFGMLSVTYVFDDSLVGKCSSAVTKAEHHPDAWTPHQILALAVALVVPSIALLIENLISRELFHAYAKLKNPSLTIEYILEKASRSRDAGIRRASNLFQQRTSTLSIAPQLDVTGLGIPPDKDSSEHREKERESQCGSVVKVVPVSEISADATESTQSRRSSLLTGPYAGGRRGSCSGMCSRCRECSCRFEEEKKEVSTFDHIDKRRSLGGKQVSWSGDMKMDEKLALKRGSFSSRSSMQKSSIGESSIGVSPCDTKEEARRPQIEGSLDADDEEAQRPRVAGSLCIYDEEAQRPRDPEIDWGES